MADKSTVNIFDCCETFVLSLMDTNVPIAEKMSALLTEEYIEARAKRASLRKFQNVLKKVPNAEPGDYDRL